jgi:two-component system, OmpR family, sensor kinase
MKGWLFWKIMIAFWLTFVIVNQGGWVAYMMYSEDESFYYDVAERVAPIQLAAGKMAVEYGGRDAFENLQQKWSKRTREGFEIVQAANGCIDGKQAFCSDSASYESARDPDGNEWQLKYAFPSATVEWSVLDAFELPDDLLIMSTLGALAFAAVLAFYLTRPVRQLRKGFESLAEGNLTARLSPAVGGRRDEIADLARDFDRMAERLQQLVQVRDQLLHDVSHELRSPLARLSQASALIRQHPNNLDASLDRIETEIRRLDDLVGELLSLARAESGESGGDQYFDLPALLESIVANAAFEAAAKCVSVNANKLHGQEGIVRGNVELLRRAVENVVRNAIQVSSAGQTVEVSMTTDPLTRRYSVSVIDAGPGVAPAKLQRMFDPFVRIGGGSTTKGYGLGLAIARRAVLALGGSIEARNRVDQGLFVTIELPIHPFDARSA